MIQQRLRETCRALLSSRAVNVVIGYGARGGGTSGGDAPYPVFVTDPAAVDQLVINDRCYQNLTTYLTRADVRRLGRPAVVVKGCDARAVVVLEQEAQLTREDVYVIGVACAGVGQPRLAKCRTCDVHTPANCDEVLGADPPGTASPADADQRYAELDEFMMLPVDQRLAHWTREMERCVRCYACRQVCPLCYCQVCVVDKNRPQVVDSSPHPMGNLAFHITRAFHLAGRCVGCDECTRVCPAGINLRLLNMSLARAVERQFDARPGTDPGSGPVSGAYSSGDREDFIR